ncbi:MAG: hypothetical protein ACAH83_15450 [Alphaproteobacteria bacterium]
MKINWKNRKVRAVIVLLTLSIFVIGCLSDMGQHGLRNLWYRITEPELSHNPHFGSCFQMCEDPRWLGQLGLVVDSTFVLERGIPCIQGCVKYYSDDNLIARLKPIGANDLAQRELCDIYMGAKGAKPDYYEAYFWCSLVSYPGTVPTEIALKENAAKHLTDAEKTNLDKRVDEWFKRHKAPKP